MGGKKTKDPFTKLFAETILETAYQRENSYDKEAAHKSKMNEAYGCIDFGKFYQLDMHQSAEAACKITGLNTDMTYAIYLLMYQWNDIIDWAEEKTGSKMKIVSN